ncbi:MAG: CO dehydrogenase/CO-methylating acetyl-CoA synthase complex subunit beta [Candidatus Brocadiales bacterium]|nr:CO dehydrogenase/CO-methylating acetyl-CoA synthase complex subunit beta [Candidatus Brocadiales bacterium]
MSRIIATAAIRGAHSIVKQAEEKLREAIESKGKDAKVDFPDTGYYLPIIYSATAFEVKTLGDCEEALGHARALLPPIPEEKIYLPYLGWALDAGIATLFAEEVIEACKYLIGPNPVDGIWLGAAADVILRERGIEFVDGTAPGFAAVVGAAPTNEIAVQIARELQEKNLYIFISGNTDGKSFAEQLDEEGVQLGWETRLVPFGKNITSTIYSLGFANKAALSFGGIKPADFTRNLLYNKNRIFAFVMALGEVDDEKYANAAGAINYGFPTIADTDIPEILPTGVCTYEHVVPLIPHDKIVEKCIEVRGLKVAAAKVDIPVAYGPAFEGERIRKDDMQIEVGGPGTPAFEYVVMRDNNDIEDGKIEVVGPEMDEMEIGPGKPLGVYVEVSGRKMQSDFEPIFERRTHHFLGEAQGFFHMGQRDIIRHRISKDAFDKGFRIKHLGNIIHSKYHEEYGALLDKVQVTLYTDKEEVEKKLDEVKAAFTERDDRALGMTDASVNQFYSCTLCQSFAPSHVCIISPERSGLCGAVSWLDGKAGYEITPTGPNQPIEKGKTIDEKLGLWEGTNDFLYNASNKEFEQVSMYSMVTNPMTSCGCFECISAMLPLTNGIMTVDRDFTGMTPCGMKFSTLAGTVGGGIQTPGFVGHSKFYMGSSKFISGDGGLARMVWMPKHLKDEIADALTAAAEEAGLEDFINKIADETIAQTEEEVLEHLQKVDHPVLKLDPMF